MAGCRCRVGPASTTGPASSRSPSCRRGVIPLPAASSAPTTRSCPTPIHISCRATGICRTGRSGSTSCLPPNRVQSPAASAAIQADTLSIAARRLVPLMSRIGPRDDVSREAIERLRAWDFRMDAGNVEPLLFTAWLRAFAEAVFVGQLGDAGKDYWNLHPEVIENVLTHYSEWCAISTVAGVGASFRGSSQSGEGRGAGRASTHSGGHATERLRRAAFRDLGQRAGGPARDLRSGYGHMAMGACPYREVPERGILAHPGAARLDRRRDTDRAAGPTR